MRRRAAPAQLDPVLLEQLRRAALRDLKWYSTQEVADLCRRSVGTIRTLTSRHRLPRRLGWAVRERARRRVCFYPEPVVRVLQRLTIFADSRARKRATGDPVGQPIDRGRALETS
jgi:hypothetical protein